MYTCPSHGWISDESPCPLCQNTITSSTIEIPNTMTDNKQVSSLDEAAELLPCPFCGNDNIKIEQFTKNGLYLRCRKCAIGYKQKVIHKSLEWLKDFMIQKWNTRL